MHERKEAAPSTAVHDHLDFLTSPESLRNLARQYRRRYEAAEVEIFHLKRCLMAAEARADGTTDAFEE